MKPSVKLTLDILLGAVVPILILNWLTRPLGAPLAYVLAALVPVGWVLADLLVITRQFNVVTSIVGLTAVVNGALAFWFVDGLQFAFKDSMALIIMTLAFSLSAIAGRPLMRFFFRQIAGADTAERRAALDGLFREPAVARAGTLGTLIVALQNAAAAIFNLLLNLRIVTAAFGTEDFNGQVAQVNAITRLVLPLAGVVGFGLAVWLIYQAVERVLPPAGAVDGAEADLWERLARRAPGMGSGRA